jgi:DNA processing protein
VLAGRIDPARVRERLEAVGAWFVPVHGEAYPGALLDLYDPPAGLFVRGRIPQEEQTCVSIVGARTCSPSGAEIAAGLAGAVARAGGCVVSGGARGIDAAAHRGALDAGRAEGEASSVAVLGCGIDIAYPAGNRRLLERVARHGAVISEYPPGTPAEPFRFPARNRIVAGLSRAVLVVEGAPGSGSMITADHALDLGREVFAVPGAVTSELAAAPLALIREGAGLIRGPDDLLEDLGLMVPSRGRRDRDSSRDGAMASVPPGLSGVEELVWKALRAPSSADALARQAGIDVRGLMGALTGLEIQGLVRHVGGRFERRSSGYGEAPIPGREAPGRL